MKIVANMAFKLFKLQISSDYQMTVLILNGFDEIVLYYKKEVNNYFS